MLFGYLAFALFIADVKQPRFNRVLLWGIMAFGLAMPFIPSVNWPAGSVVAAELSAGTPDILAVAADEHPVAIGKILYIVYLAGVVAVLSFMTGSLIRLIRYYPFREKGGRRRWNGCRFHRCKDFSFQLDALYHIE